MQNKLGSAVFLAGSCCVLQDFQLLWHTFPPLEWVCEKPQPLSHPIYLASVEARCYFERRLLESRRPVRRSRLLAEIENERQNCIRERCSDRPRAHSDGSPTQNCRRDHICPLLLRNKTTRCPILCELINGQQTSGVHAPSFNLADTGNAKVAMSVKSLARVRQQKHC